MPPWYIDKGQQKTQQKLIKSLIRYVRKQYKQQNNHEMLPEIKTGETLEIY